MQLAGPGSPTRSFGSDRKNGLGGYWATQILPFGDPTLFAGYLDFETATYAAPPGSTLEIDGMDLRVNGRHAVRLWRASYANPIMALGCLSTLRATTARLSSTTGLRLQSGRWTSALVRIVLQKSKTARR